MKILYRYLFLSISKPLAFSLLSLVLLWLLYDLFDTLPDFVNQKPPLALIVQFYLVQLPKIAQLVIPVGFLFSTLYVMTYFSQHRELVAMHAAGLSLARITWPLLVVAVLLSLVLTWLNWELAPGAELKRNALTQQMSGRSLSADIRRALVFKNPDTGTLWYVQELNLSEGTLRQAEILLYDADGKPREKIFAAQGRYRDGFWDLAGARRIDLRDTRPGARGTELLQFDARELTEKPKEMIAQLLPPEQISTPELFGYLTGSYRPPPSRAAAYATELHYRFAYPWICVVLALFGISLGAGHARRNMAASIFNCIFLLFGLLIWINFSLALGTGNRIPPFLAAWSGILTFGLIGLGLYAERSGWLWILLWSKKAPFVPPARPATP
jgi:lipopolysaccharide export system permease protein